MRGGGAGAAALALFADGGICTVCEGICCVACVAPSAAGAGAVLLGGGAGGTRGGGGGEMG